MNGNTYVSLFLIISFALILGCTSEKVQFTEKILDNNSLGSVWMKSFGDINGDGKADLLAGGWEKGGLVAYLAPDWKKQVICDSLKISTDAEVCDIDNDKKNDILVIVNHALIWFKAPDWNYFLIDSTDLHDVEVGDLDNDGLLDVIARDQGEFNHRGDTLYIYHQQPLGKWSKYMKIIANGEGLKLADINADQRDDIIVNGYWFENTGDIQHFEKHKFTDSWNWPNTYIDVADINDDGLSDILLSPSEKAGNFYHISWFEAPENKSSTWKEHIVVDSVETVIHFIGAADFNKDGKMDFMIAHMTQGANPDEVAVYYQRRGNTWGKQVISTDGSHSMRLCDLDEDGDIDAYGANWNGNIVKMWINEGE